MAFFSCFFNLCFFFNPRATVYHKVELDGIISLLGCHVSVSVPLALAQRSMFIEQKWTDSLEVSFSATYILWQRRLNKELTGFVKGHTLDGIRKQPWGNSQVFSAVWLLHSTLGKLVTCPVSGLSVRLPAIPQVTSSGAWLAFVYFAYV